MADERPPLRASDADREKIAEVLREHTSAGRLTIDEFEERVSAAYAARTIAELRPLIADLPVRSDDVLPPETAPAFTPKPPPWLASRPGGQEVSRSSGQEVQPRHGRLAWRLSGLGVAILVLTLVALAGSQIGYWPLFILGGFFFYGPGARHRRHHRHHRPR